MFVASIDSFDVSKIEIYLGDQTNEQPVKAKEKSDDDDEDYEDDDDDDDNSSGPQKGKT